MLFTSANDITAPLEKKRGGFGGNVWHMAINSLERIRKNQYFKFYATFAKNLGENIVIGPVSHHC